MEKDSSLANSKRIAIIGSPNSGKSQIFSNLTGEYALVSNYPFSTISIKKASYFTPEDTCEVFDTPGIYSLLVQSEEGIAVRDLILSGEVDVILQCIDANVLKQSLSLTAELLDLGIPLVIAVNAIDETLKKGIWIDSVRLSQLLGVPVIESIAVKGVGTNRLRKAMKKAMTVKHPIYFGDIIEFAISSVASALSGSVKYRRETALLMLLKDPHIVNHLKKTVSEELLRQITAMVDDVERRFKRNPAKLISHKRSQWVDDIYNKISKKQNARIERKSEVAARMCRSPLYGLPILMTIVVMMYLMVVNVANRLADSMHKFLWSPSLEWLDKAISSSFWKDFLIGHYGVLNLGVAGALLTIMPVLSIFFILYGILEDVGYIPNLSVLSKRVLNKIGLSGAAILPMVLGFGCKTMATLSTKTLLSKKEKYITIFLIAFAIPCAPQIGLSMSLLGRLGITAFAILVSVLITVEIATGLVLNKMIREDKKNLFILALPSIRMPNPKNILKKTCNRLYEFMQEAYPVFIYAAVTLFTLDRLGILRLVKSALAPVVNRFLGLPLDMVDALSLVLATRSLSAVIIYNLLNAGNLDFVQGIVAVTLTTMFFPCFANIGVIIKQLGVRSAIIMVSAITLSSVLIAGGLNWGLRAVF